MSAISEFDRTRLRFRPAFDAEALFLLRPVIRYGHIGKLQPALPPTLSGLVWQPCTLDVTTLRNFLQNAGVAENDVGGNLNTPVSETASGSTAGSKAKYFVIHDTSQTVDGNAFPGSINSTWAGNNLNPHLGPNANAHIFINRRGQSGLGHDYSVPWRATKFENGTVGCGLLVKGLFLHHELIQPRLLDSHGIDSIAPDPGFTDAQYDRLALCYVAASLRRGKWMIPSYHATLDEGLSDAHDDPQNFDLGRWDARLGALLQQLNQGFSPVNVAEPVAATVPEHHDDDWEPTPGSVPVGAPQVYQKNASSSSSGQDNAHTSGLTGLVKVYSDGSQIIEATENLSARRDGHQLANLPASSRICIKGTARRIEQTNYTHVTSRHLPHAFAFEQMHGLSQQPPPGYTLAGADQKKATQFGKNDNLDGGTGSPVYGIVQTCSEVWGASLKETRMKLLLGNSWKTDPRRLDMLVEVFFNGKLIRVPLVDVGPGAPTAHVDLTWAADQFLDTQGGAMVDFQVLIPI
jgi:hypothetical protein